MPKPPLIPEQSLLEQQIIETLTAGLKEWRPDLDYPESHSDMQACARGLIQMFTVKRSPLPIKLKVVCSSCDGIGHLVLKAENHSRELKTCVECGGRGWVI